MRFVDVKTDIAFKKVFGNEQHQEILIGFLNAVLDLQGERAIREVTLKNPWQPPDIAILKQTILDIKAVDNRGVSFIVEMQVEKKYAMDKRVQYYSAKAYTSQIEKGEDYPKLNQVIFIGILDFNCFEGKDYLTRHLILNQATQRQELKDLEFNFLELPKFEKREEELEGIVEKWTYFIKNAGNLSLIPQSAEAIPELREAYQQASMFSWSPQELEIYEYWKMEETSDRYRLQEEYQKGEQRGREEGEQRGRLEGEQRGRLEGERQGKLAVAANLKSTGTSLEIIRQVTGLSSEDLATLL